MKLIKDNEVFLKATINSHRGQGTALVSSAKKHQLDSICEVLLNIVHGIIPVSNDIVKKAARYKSVLRQIVGKLIKTKLRKELIIKYFNIVKQLLAFALPVIGVIVTGCQLASS